MLDQVTAPTDAHASVSVSTEARGRARDIRRQIEREDAEYDRTILALLQPARDRLKRFPRRSLRPETLVDLIEGWRHLDARDWRLDLNAELERTRAALVERRLVAGHTRHANGVDQWEATEADIAAVEIALLIDHSTLHLRSRCLATFSQHAIARRLQRHADGSVEALLHDIAVVADAAAGELVAGAGYRVRTHPDGGGWRGRAVLQTGPDRVTRTVIAVRTWMPE